MREGLMLVQVPGRYGYSVTRVGWFKRVQGDEWELLAGSVSTRRTSGTRNLDELAADGPMSDHFVSKPFKSVEPVHRLVLRRALYANVEAWPMVKKPKGWTDK